MKLFNYWQLVHIFIKRAAISLTGIFSISLTGCNFFNWIFLELGFAISLTGIFSWEELIQFHVLYCPTDFKVEFSHYEIQLILLPVIITRS